MRSHDKRNRNRNTRNLFKFAVILRDSVSGADPPGVRVPTHRTYSEIQLLSPSHPVLCLASEGRSQQDITA